MTMKGGGEEEKGSRSSCWAVNSNLWRLTATKRTPSVSEHNVNIRNARWSHGGSRSLTGESAVGSLLIIQPQRGRVTEGHALIVIDQLWTPVPPTCKRGQRSNKSSQAQQE